MANEPLNIFGTFIQCFRCLLLTSEYLMDKNFVSSKQPLVEHILFLTHNICFLIKPVISCKIQCDCCNSKNYDKNNVGVLEKTCKLVIDLLICYLFLSRLLNPLSKNLTKWSNVLKACVCCCRKIV